MINLEQIQSLNTKVQKALDVIVSLREENNTLREKLGGYEKRIEELEVTVNSFSRDQDDIENGILNILQQLDRLEEDVSSKADDNSDISSDNYESVEEPAGPPAETSDLDRNEADSDVTPTPPVHEEPENQEFENSEPEAELDIF